MTTTIDHSAGYAGAVVRPHPTGGYTLAVPTTGTCREYRDWFPSRHAAGVALKARRDLVAVAEGRAA